MDDFRTKVLQGLSARAKHLPCKYLCDARGAELSDRICTLARRVLSFADGAAHSRRPWRRDGVGAGAALSAGRVRSGSGTKTRLLLAMMEDPVAYVPVDIAQEQIAATSQSLARQFPRVQVLPVCADYTRALALPAPRRRPCRTAVFFPGSTTGNFEPAEAAAFLERTADVVGHGGAFLIGVDRKKKRARPGAGLQRSGGCDGRVQPQPPRAHQL